MKHRTIAICLVTALLLFLMVWSFGSSAANSQPPGNPSIQTNESNVPPQGDEDADVDADLGKWGSRSGIDHDTYLRLRDEYIARKRGIEPGRPFDPSMRGRAIDQMDRQENNRKLESLVNGNLTPPIGTDAAWTPIGPAPLPNGFGSTYAPNPAVDSPVSGRVTSVAVDPTNPNKVYLGTAQGGVWRSLDAGATWTAIFDGAQSLAIGALALAPSNPTILYVGTGEFNGCGDCFFGVGLYRIDNVDTAPSLVGPMNPSVTIGNLTYNVFNGRGITKVLVHPTDSATIFVATARGIAGSGANRLGVVPAMATRGVFRSTNATSAAGAVTFQKLVVTSDGSLDIPATGDADTTDLVMEPGNPNNIMVGLIGLTGSNSGIYRTTNALSATPSFTQTLALPLSGGSGIRVQLAINKVGSTVTAYAATSETPTATSGCTTARSGAVRKITDPFGAGTWSGQLTGGGGFCSAQCFYDMPIAVDPNDANVVYIGGQTSSSCGGVVRKSINGGTSFANDSTVLHPDDHVLFFDGAGNIYTGNDGGVWKRSASAAAGSVWTNLNNSALNTLQFESIAVHPTDPFLMIGGTQDNGSEYQQTSSGNWRNTEGGDGGYSLIDQSATDTTNVTMYHTFYNAMADQIGFDRINKTSCLPCFDSWESRGPGAFSSGLVPLCDGTLSATSCDGTPAAAANGINLSDNVLFYAPMALGPGSPNTFYFGTEKLYRSNDRGDTMTVVSQAPINSTPCNTNPTGPCPISTIAISPQGDNVRVVGLQSGQVWATSTGSSTLVDLTTPATSFSFPVNPTGTTNKFVGRAVVDPNNKNVAYVALSYFAPAGQGIWKITNLVAAGAASPAAPVWTASSNGIPSIPINGLVIDPINSNYIYAGTDIGVYVSTDGGASWNPFGTGLPRSAVFDLQIQPSNRILRAGTHGRGVWETPLISPGASTVQFSAAADSADEGQGGKTVTITRTGVDLTFPASVNYATSDNSGANNCNVITGFASSRCDYIATSGTLNFAAGESSKNILIPIVDDAYVEGPETFTVTLSAAGGNNVTLGTPSTITITIVDNDLPNEPNPIDVSRFYVRQHYIDFLNREPDTPGLNFWTNNIDGCMPQPGCTEIQRLNTSAAFFISVEFQETGYLVERIYKAAYGDVPGTSTIGGTHTLQVPIIRISEFLPDTQKIGQGVVVNVGNWQQQLENNKQAFTEDFVQRSRFLTAYPLTMTAAQFVDGLNAKAATNGVMPLTQAQRDQLVSDLSAGIQTRAQVLRAVAENQTLYIAEYNRAFVLMQYFGYLRRNPNDPQDSDYRGYDFWLAKLNQFNGNYIAAEMVKAFLVSVEYRQRFGP
jgi:hypothetical protein